VSYFDPFVPAIEHEGWGMTSEPDLLAAARRADCVVIVTHHSAIDYRALVEAAVVVFDTRNAVGAAGVQDAKVIRL
jgi:UDP-N-acetyl-D-glucosamine dehydrogenase